MTTKSTIPDVSELPGLDCGACGFRTCKDFAARLQSRPELRSRCIHLSSDMLTAAPPTEGAGLFAAPCGHCGSCNRADDLGELTWRDSLDREFHFYLEHFPEDPGPREIILPHNPMLTRELDLQPGDSLIGRPLGMSCGCPITHCGIVMDVDPRTGVMTWCVTGPLTPREQGYKDIGYYSAEGYEGLVTHSQEELRIGARYWFQPRMCMLQWRHSGLINYLNRVEGGWQVRLEGLWIG